MKTGLEAVHNFENELYDIVRKLKSLSSEAEFIRSWYKYQDSNSMKSASESFIVSYESLDIEGMIESLQELVENEDDQ